MSRLLRIADSGRCTVRPDARPARYICALFVAWSLVPAVAAQTDGQRQPLVDLSGVEIDNFGRVNANYYRGAQPHKQHYTELAAIGVRTVIDLTSDDREANAQTMAERAGLTYVRIPMTTRVPPTQAQLAEFLRIVTDPVSQPVYVHCVGGRHRTGVMTAVYRMTQDGWTADQAFKEMKQYKFGFDFLHPEFKEFVYTYHVDAVSVGGQPRS
jgi:protein tyrosine/serine phosphatase